MRMKLFLMILMSYTMFFALEEITPYKFTDQDMAAQKSAYKIPESSRLTTKRLGENNSDIIYYLSKPKADSYPIAICCGGSSFRNSLYSIIHFHRYFLQEFLGMTYMYHADALQYPQADYKQIKTPFLVVAGAQDTIIDSCDAFVQKAKMAGVNITYLRIEDMDHYIRKRPEIAEQSFQWLSLQLR